MSANLKSIITSSPPEPEVCPYVHEKFPPGRKIGSPAVGISDDKNFSSFRLERGNSMYHKRKDKLVLPKLPTDNSLTLRKNKNCSFVNNHKNYLKLKGFELSHVYSLNRNRTHKDSTDSSAKNVMDMSSKIAKLSESDIHLPALFPNELATPRRGSTQKDSESVWRPGDSLKPNDVSVTYANLAQNFNQVTKASSHVRLGYLTSNRLGQVMTKTHLKSLLAQDEPLVTKAVYMKPANGI